MQVTSWKAAGLALLLTAAPLSAESPIAPTHTGETGLFELFSGQNMPGGSWSFSLYYNNFDRLIEVGNNEFDVDRHRASASVGYAFTDQFELSLMAPYESVDLDGAFGDDPEGAGNLRLGGKWMLSGDEDGGFALNFFVLAPTGDEDVVNDDTGFGAGLAWNRNNFFANLGYADRGDPDVGEQQEQILAGVGHALPVNDRFFWLTELNGTFWTGDGFAEEDSVDLVTGGRVFFGETGDWAFNFALRTDLLQFDDVDEHCPIGGLVGLTFAPRFRPEPEPEPEPAPAPPPPPPAPEPEPQPEPAPEPPPPPPEERITIPFDQGDRLNNIAKARLDEVALKMKQDPDLGAQVIGYTDSTGTDEINERVSLQRAEAVKAYLVDRHGIDARRIATEGRGSADPVASNDTAAGRQENRRAVVILKVE